MKIKAQIDRMIDDGSKVKAYASVILGEEFVVRNIAVMDGKNGLFASMPSRSYRDRKGNTQYSDIVFGLTEDARSTLNNAVVSAYEQRLHMREDESREFDEESAFEQKM